MTDTTLADSLTVQTVVASTASTTNSPRNGATVPLWHRPDLERQVGPLLGEERGGVIAFHHEGVHVHVHDLASLLTDVGKATR